MEIRQIVIIDHETWREAGREASPPPRQVAACAVVANPFAGRPALNDLAPMVELSVEVGTILTERALRTLGDRTPTAYGKAVIVGSAGDREQGAAMIHVRLGLAMRRGAGKGLALIPGIAKVAGPGAAIDLPFGDMDNGWEYDTMDTMEVSVPGAPKPDEIVLIVGFASGGRPNARVHGPSAEQVAALVRELRD